MRLYNHNHIAIRNHFHSETPGPLLDIYITVLEGDDIRCGALRYTALTFALTGFIIFYHSAENGFFIALPFSREWIFYS